MDSPRFFHLYAVLETSARRKRFATYLATRISEDSRPQLPALLEGWVPDPAAFEQHARAVFSRFKIGWSSRQYHRELSYLCQYLEEFLLAEHVRSHPLLRRVLLAEYFGEKNDTENLGYIQRQLESFQHDENKAGNVFEHFLQLRAMQWGLQLPESLSDDHVENFNSLTQKANDTVYVLTQEHQAALEVWQRQYPKAGFDLFAAYNILAPLLTGAAEQHPDVEMACMVIEMTREEKPTRTQVIAWRQAFTSWAEKLPVPKRQHMPGFHYLYNATVRYRNAHMTLEANTDLWELLRDSITGGYGLHKGQIPPVSWPGWVKVAASVMPFSDFKHWYDTNLIQRLMPHDLDGLATARILYDWTAYLSAPDNQEAIPICKRIVTGLHGLRSPNKHLVYLLRLLAFKAQYALEAAGASEPDPPQTLRRLRSLKKNVVADVAVKQDTRARVLLEINLLDAFFARRKGQDWEALHLTTAETPGLNDKGWYLAQIAALRAGTQDKRSRNRRAKPINAE